MIKLESAHIEEVRGIRNLDIDFQKSAFAISGPNGSGKSGVIDAIEFALTGSISRLMGRGTKGLSVSEHGPHVDKAKHVAARNVHHFQEPVALGGTAQCDHYEANNPRCSKGSLFEMERLSASPRSPIAIQSIEIEALRIEHTASPSQHVGVFFVGCTGEAFEEAPISMRATDILRRTRILARYA